MTSDGTNAPREQDHPLHFSVRYQVGSNGRSGCVELHFTAEQVRALGPHFGDVLLEMLADLREEMLTKLVDHWGVEVKQ
jgi:hypothetical protein